MKGSQGAGESVESDKMEGLCKEAQPHREVKGLPRYITGTTLRAHLNNMGVQVRFTDIQKRADTNRRGTTLARTGTCNS